MSDAPPTSRQAAAIDAFADAVYDLLHTRAQSIGILDIVLEIDSWHIDCELMFSSGPDLGFSMDARSGECRYCELLPGQSERWLDEVRGDLLVLGADGSPDLLDAAALQLLDGILAARRTVLARSRGSGR